MTLEYGVTVLALELARQNSLAEVEFRLRRDLVEELPGSDDESALARARALGYDLDVHRSTLKYRLKRIAEVSGHDLANPETVINLQLATRARRIMSALREKS